PANTTHPAQPLAAGGPPYTYSVAGPWPPPCRSRSVSVMVAPVPGSTPVSLTCTPGRGPPPPGLPARRVEGRRIVGLPQPAVEPGPAEQLLVAAALDHVAGVQDQHL